MIEIVEKLIPLVEGATTGAIWLIVGYFILTFMLAVVPAVTVAYVMTKLPKIISSFKGVKEIGFISVAKGAGIHCKASEDNLHRLLRAVCNGNGFIWDSEVEAAIRKLRE